MATVIERKKDGKVVSYKFRAYLGKDENGTQITRYTTWHIPDGLSPAKARKAADTAAAEWEENALAGRNTALNMLVYFLV